MFDKLYLKKGIVYIFFVHLITFVSTLIIVLIFPKIFNVVDYGYWQVYTLYTGYVGITHLGFMDGLYLKVIGKPYNELDKKLLKSHFITQALLQTIVSIFISIFLLFNFKNERLIILLLVAISIPIINIKTYFQYILQATGKIKQFSILQIVDRISLVVFILFIYIFNNSFVTLVVGDVLSKILLLVISIVFCKDILLCKDKYVFDNIDFFSNISIGIKIMVANLCGGLLIGISRFFVDNNFSIDMYSQYSLSLTFSSLFVSVFASVGIVLMPYIKNNDIEINKKMYLNMHFITSLIILFAMIFYYPIFVLLSKWLPNYEMSFKLMSILFPILYLECQFNFIDCTYMKTLRLEKKLMNNYLASTIFVLIMTFLVLSHFHNLYYIAFILLISFIIRNVMCQINIIDEMQISNIKYKIFFIINTFIFPILFCVSNAIIKNHNGFIFFTILYVFYIIYINKVLEFDILHISDIFKNWIYNND